MMLTLPFGESRWERVIRAACVEAPGGEIDVGCLRLRNERRGGPTWEAVPEDGYTIDGVHSAVCFDWADVLSRCEFVKRCDPQCEVCKDEWE